MRTTTLLLLGLLLGGCAPTAGPTEPAWWLEPPATADRIAFQADDGLWGYRDASGTVVIEPRFGYAVSFPGEGNVLVQRPGDARHVRVTGRGLGRVRVGGKWGYVDRAGQVVIAPQYDEAMDFFEDLTAVRLGARWGYIDATGSFVLPPQFDEASPFLLGVAHVRQGERWFTIDRQGRDTAERP